MLVEGLGEKTLQTGKNVIGIKVKDNEIEKDYQVVINRLKSKESRLSNIEIENHELNKIFNKEDYEYEVTTKENSLNIKVSKIKKKNQDR